MKLTTLSMCALATTPQASALRLFTTRSKSIHPNTTNTSVETPITSSGTSILPPSQIHPTPTYTGYPYIEKINNTKQDQEDIQSMVRFLKNIPDISTSKPITNIHGWIFEFMANYNAANQTLESSTPTHDTHTFLSNQWLQRTFKRAITILRSNDPETTLTIAGIFKDNCGVIPHRDPSYDTIIIAMGAFRKDNDQPIDGSGLDLIINTPKQKYAIPQNPAGGHWAAFSGHDYMHFTGDTSAIQRAYDLPYTTSPPYYRLQITAHVSQPNTYADD